MAVLRELIHCLSPCEQGKEALWDLQGAFEFFCLSLLSTSGALRRGAEDMAAVWKKWPLEADHLTGMCFCLFAACRQLWSTFSKGAACRAMSCMHWMRTSGTWLAETSAVFPLGGWASSSPTALPCLVLAASLLAVKLFLWLLCWDFTFQTSHSDRMPMLMYIMHFVLGVQVDRG